MLNIFFYLRVMTSRKFQVLNELFNKYIAFNYLIFLSHLLTKNMLFKFPHKKDEEFILEGHILYSIIVYYIQFIFLIEYLFKCSSYCIQSEFRKRFCSIYIISTILARNISSKICVYVYCVYIMYRISIRNLNK